MSYSVNILFLVRPAFLDGWLNVIVLTSSPISLIKPLLPSILIGSANIRWDLTDFLYVRGQVGTDRYDYHRTISTPFGTRYQPLGSIGEYKLTFKQYDADFFLGTDNLAITSDVSLTGFLGVGSNYQQSESVSANGSNFIVPGLINVKNTAAQSNGYGFSEKKITSAFGSAELGFKDYAFLTVTARNDWFSTLSLAGKDAPNNDLYTSASFSFRICFLPDKR